MAAIMTMVLMEGVEKRTQVPKSHHCFWTLPAPKCSTETGYVSGPPRVGGFETRPDWCHWAAKAAGVDDVLWSSKAQQKLLCQSPLREGVCQKHKTSMVLPLEPRLL